MKRLVLAVALAAPRSRAPPNRRLRRALGAASTYLARRSIR